MVLAYGAGWTDPARQPPVGDSHEAPPASSATRSPKGMEPVVGGVGERGADVVAEREVAAGGGFGAVGASLWMLRDGIREPT